MIGSRLFLLEPTTLFGPLCALCFSPLLLGIINRVKAMFAGRRGQPLLQPYFDIVKLLRKGAVYSTTTTTIFRIGPVVGLAAMITASCIVPFGHFGSIMAFPGDIIVFAYLLGLNRFLTIASALDTGSAFEGMGASREALYSILLEPVLLLALYTVARQGGGLQFSSFLGSMHHPAIASSLLIAVSLFLVALAENCRIPFDDPNTHLELTMIHEVMVLDNSGPDFAFITYTAAIKLWLMIVVIAGILIPSFGLSGWKGTVALVGMVFFVTVVVGIVESTIARVRLLRVPQLIMSAAALVAVGLLAGAL